MVPITTGSHRIIVARQGAIIVAGVQADKFPTLTHTVQQTVQSVLEGKGPNHEDNDGAKKTKTEQKGDSNAQRRREKFDQGVHK